MVIYFMISRIMKIFVKKLRLLIQCCSGHYSAIKGTSQIKLYNELGLESLEFRWWFGKLCLFYKIKKTYLPEYLFNMIPQSNHQYNSQLRMLELFMAEQMYPNILISHIPF